jgi:hypothetical protein
MKYVKEITVKNDNNNLYNDIIKHNINFVTIKWSQKLYNYYNNITSPPKCLNCGGDVKFHSITKGYRKYCSNKCHLKSELTKEKRSITKLKKYGDINYNNRNKFKESCLIKFGETSPMKNKDILNKSINTNIIKYGEKTPLLNDKIINKIKESKLKKYDNINYNNRNQAKKTIIEKYGVNHQMNDEGIRDKIKNTNLIKYGVENVFQNKEIIEKIKMTNSLTFKVKWSEILKIPIDNIKINNDIVSISGLCSIHDTFDITKSLLYDRYRYNVTYCTKCNLKNSNASDAENNVRDFIENELTIKTEKISIDNKEIDIYLPDYKLGIEYNGLYWHSEFFKNKNYHLNKTEICENQGIQLLHIFEDEWMFKREIVKSIIKSKLNIVDIRIFARKCQIKEIDSNKSREFLEDNHIQGNVNSKYKLGLFYNDELVSYMSFEKTRKSIEKNNENSYVLNRFCSKLNTQVIGGASKLLKYFIRIYNPKSIISFADKRYSNGNLYKQLGFIRIKDNMPSYFYFKNNELVRYHRFNFRKEILIKRGFDKNKTEFEIMTDNNYIKIFDCGNIKYLLEF